MLKVASRRDWVNFFPYSLNRAHWKTQISAGIFPLWNNKRFWKTLIWSISPNLAGNRTSSINAQWWSMQSRQFFFTFYIWRFNILLVHYTPRLWCDGCNSFDIVCVSVCPSVHPSVSLFQLNAQTYGLEFWHGGQVEGYLGQGHRSKVNVTRSIHVSVHCAIDFWEPSKEKTQEYNW